tara:strand:- start:182 stop:1315 length:1134 start_codon:yes stop_codon:yes gene_type:complete
MKKIFILTGEPSGDKLASKVINKLMSKRSDISYLSVGGENLRALGIKSLYDLKDVTFLGFTSVFLNIFKIKKKIKDTTNEIINFSPDILFSVDSPDFTLRIAKNVKKKNPNIKIIHFVAPQVWIWRSSRIKKIKNIVDHMLLLFKFEKKIFDQEHINSTFVGHPLLDSDQNQREELDNTGFFNKRIISLFPGSRMSEIKILMPILINFVLLVQKKTDMYSFVFHSTSELEIDIKNFIKEASLEKCEIISNNKNKKYILNKSIFAIAKSGTVSLEISNAQIPSLIIYKMGFINFFIIKLLVNTKYANIFNIIAKKIIIPELLQSKCNAEEIFRVFNSYINNPEFSREQLLKCNKILKEIRNESSSIKTVSDILSKSLS